MAIERVCVIGAGAIGSLIVAHLGRVCEVSVLTRRSEHAEQINAHGMRVSGKSDHVARATATEDAAELQDFDVGIFACKALDLQETAARLQGIAPQATMMTIQNGIGAEEIVHRYGPWPLVSGVTFMSGIRHSDTHVEYELDTATWMGPWAQTETPYATVKELADLFIAGGLKAEAMPDLLPAQWSKLIFNSAVNGVAALTELPHVSLFAREQEITDLGHLVHALMREGVAVAAAVGIELHDDPWEMNRLAVTQGETDSSDYAHLPSMLEDVLARRPTEIDFITGALVREAHRVGVPVPLSEAVYQLIKGKELSFNQRKPAEVAR